MKYTVSSLLTGIEAYKKVQLGIKSRTIKSLEREYRQAQEKFRLGISHVQPELAHASDQLLRETLTAEETADMLRDLVHQIERANRSYDLRRAERDYKAAMHELDNLHGGTKTEFELWLLSLQDEGVTEITSNSIKTAGFDEKSVTKYVTAARKLKSQEAQHDSVPA